jgi:WD40 repeat protein
MINDNGGGSIPSPLKASADSSHLSSKGLPIRRSSTGFLSRIHIEVWGETHLGSPVWCMSASKSGILCGCDDGSIVLLNSNLDCCFRLQEAHGHSAVVRLSWSADGSHFLSVGTDKRVIVWGLDTAGTLAAKPIYTMVQISPVISADFHPSTYPDTMKLSTGSEAPTFSKKAKPPSCIVLVLTVDRKITVWTDGLVEQYESLSVKDATPVCMSLHQSYIAIGTRSGEMLLYSFKNSVEGIVFIASLTCRNRRGKFKEGTPIVGISWVSDNELLISSQDDRLRLASFENGKSLAVKHKLKGHESSKGNVALAAFTVIPPFGQKIVQCGSECGRIYIWGLSKEESERPSSFLTKFSGSSAIRPIESWVAVGASDKLTAVASAPWIPEKGRIGASSTLAASLDGAVRLYICKYDS